jgi:very-short-patch-repair endonuclease
MDHYIYRKPRKSLTASAHIAQTIGDPSPASVPYSKQPRRTQKYAQDRKKIYTSAEKKFERLLCLWGLEGTFEREWVFKNWILDFYFRENRLGIEIDGSYHESPKQSARDASKTGDCERAGITILRLTNEEVLGRGNRRLIRKLRVAWRKAYRRSRLMK